MSRKLCLFDAFTSRRVWSGVVLVLWMCVQGGCGRDQDAPDIASSSPSSEVTARLESKPDAPDAPARQVTPPEPDSGSRSSGEPSFDNKPSAENQEIGMTGIEDASPAQLREAALQALGQDQDDLAFDLVREVMRVAPDDPQAVFLHALVLGDRYRFHEAIKLLDDLADKTPATRLPALGQTAEWLVMAGQYDEAETRYRTILNELPDSSMVHRHLARMLLQVGKRSEAAVHFRYLAQSGELNQDELCSLLSLSNPLVHDGESSRLEPYTRLARARNELALGRLDKAREILESEGNLTDVESSFRARILAMQNDYEPVRQWATDREIASNDSDGWFALGSLAANDDDSAKAIQCYSKSLLVDYTDAEAYERLSKSLAAIGEDAKAEEADKRAKLIRQTHQIGANLAAGNQPEREQIAAILPLLQQLNRPLEVLGWQSIDLVFAADNAVITEQQAESIYLAIGQQRAQLLQSGLHHPDPAFILCGLNTIPDESKK